YVFGSEDGGFLASFKTAWESLLQSEWSRHEAGQARRAGRPGEAPRNRPALARPAARRRLSAAGRRRRHPSRSADPGTLRHQTTQRYLNITDEELRKALTGVWERRRLLNEVWKSETVNQKDAAAP